MKSVLLTCLLLALPTFAFAELPASAYRLKTLEQIEQLAPEVQAEYFQNLQDLMIDLENFSSAKKDQAYQDYELNRFNLLLEALISRATAAANKTSDVRNFVPGQTLYANGKRASCPGGYVAIPVSLGPGTGIQKACGTPGGFRKSCPDGTVPVGQAADGRFQCLTNASFNRLPEQLKIGIRLKNPTAAANPSLTSLNAAFRAISTPFDDKPYNPVVANAKTSPINQTTPTNPTANENQAVPSAAQTAVRNGNAKTFSRIEGVSKADIDSFRTSQSAKEDQDDQAVSEREDWVNQCVGPEDQLQRTCPKDVVEKGRRALYGTDKRLCVYGGNFSYYRGKQARPGDCRPVFEFCFGYDSCRDKDNNKIHEPDVSCGANQILCNPYLFSLQTNNEPYCVSKGQNATSACLQKTQESTAQGTHKPIVDRLWKHALYKHGTRNKKLDTWMNGFSEFAKRFNETCQGDQATKDAFCAECNMIQRRILWMNARAIKKVHELAEKSNKNDCFAFLSMKNGSDSVEAVANRAAPPDNSVTLPGAKPAANQ